MVYVYKTTKIIFSQWVFEIGRLFLAWVVRMQSEAGI